MVTIPRGLDPDTAPRVLPDYSRSDSTIERMIRALDVPVVGRGVQARTTNDGPTMVTGQSPTILRVLSPAHAARDCAVRSALSALLLGAALACGAGAYGAWPRPLAGDDALVLSHAPGADALMVVTAFILLAVCALALSLRFAVVALAAARARVELGTHAVHVVGALGCRRVAWEDIRAIDSRIVHPVHGVSAGLHLRDGSSVVMPAFDRPLRTYARPSGRRVRAMRRELARHRGNGRSC